VIINNTRAEWYDDCMRLGFWNDQFDGVGLEPERTDEKLLWGQITHAGLATYYSGLNDKQVENSVADAAISILDWDNLDFDERNKWTDHIDWIKRLLRAYRPWAEAKDKFSVLQIETEGMVEIGEMCWNCGEPYVDGVPTGEEDGCPKCLSPIHYMVFRVDLTVNQGGRLGVIDHKTAKSASDLYLKSWHYSPQLLWYSYGYGKALETPVNFYEVNILRKLKTVGLPQAVEKRCPDCKNGSKKKLTCAQCNYTGKVEKEEKLEPFQREHEGVNPDNTERIIRSRITLMNRIERHKELFKTDPDEAFPMSPKACFKFGVCPFLNLCWTGDAGKWYNPNPGLLMGKFKHRKEDYVTAKVMAREEMV